MEQMKEMSLPLSSIFGVSWDFLVDFAILYNLWFNFNAYVYNIIAQVGWVLEKFVYKKEG